MLKRISNRYLCGIPDQNEYRWIFCFWVIEIPVLLTFRGNFQYQPMDSGVGNRKALLTRPTSDVGDVLVGEEGDSSHMIFYMSFYIYDMPCDIKYGSLDRLVVNTAFHGVNHLHLKEEPCQLKQNISKQNDLVNTQPPVLTGIGIER